MYHMYVEKLLLFSIVPTTAVLWFKFKDLRKKHQPYLLGTNRDAHQEAFWAKKSSQT